MEEMFLGFITWQFLFFCIAIGAIVLFIRRLVEFIMDTAKVNKDVKWWRDLVLPALPIVLGQGIALLVVSYPYPAEFTSIGGRWIFGLVAGFSSGFVVRMYKSLLSGKVAELLAKVKTLLGSVPVKEEPKEEPKDKQ